MFVSNQSSIGNLVPIRNSAVYLDSKANTVYTSNLSSFSPLSSPPPATSIAYCVSGDGRIHYSLTGNTVYSSFDRGSTWISSTVGAIDGSVSTNITLSTNADGSLVIIQYGGYIVSRDYGKTWGARTAITSFRNLRIREDGVVTGLANGATAFLYTDLLNNISYSFASFGSMLEVAHSDDCAYTYIAATNGLYRRFLNSGTNQLLLSGNFFNVDCSYDGRYVYATNTAGTQYSSNYGASFSNIGASPTSGAIRCSRDGYNAIAVGSTNSAYLSFNGGVANTSGNLTSGVSRQLIYMNYDASYCVVLDVNGGIYVSDAGVDLDTGAGIAATRVFAKNFTATGESFIPSLYVRRNFEAANALVHGAIQIRRSNIDSPGSNSTVIQIGNTGTIVENVSPLCINMGASRSSALGAGLKLKLYDDTSNVWGLGANPLGLEYTVNNSASHAFRTSAGTSFSINSSTVVTTVPITSPTAANLDIVQNGGGNINANTSSGNINVTSTTGHVNLNPSAGNVNVTLPAGNLNVTASLGDVILNPTVGNVRVTLGNWNKTELGNGNTSIIFQTPDGASTGFLLQAWNGYVDSSLSNVRINPSKRIWRQYTDQRATSDYHSIDAYNGTTTIEYMRIDPAVTSRVQFGQGVQSNVLSMSTGLTTLGTPKVRIFDNGTSMYGFGIQSGVLSYEMPNATESHVFYTGGSELFRANSVGLRTSIPITSPADLTINPTGANIVMSSKTFTSLGNILMTSVTTPLGVPKISLFDTGSGKYGFGIQNAILSYETSAISDSHVFFSGNVERMRVNNAGLRMAVPITTASGNLSLVPAGSIDCNQKLANASIVSSQSLSGTGWTGTLTAQWYKIDRNAVLRITGSVTASGVQASFVSTTAIPASVRPEGANARYEMWIDGGTTGTQRISVRTDGIVVIQPADGVSTYSSNTLNFNTNAAFVPYGTI